MATLKGITPNQIYPQPGFVPSQNQNGGWEGSHRFMMSRASFDNSAVRNRFRKGTPVTMLDPNVPTFFSIMTLDRIEGCHFREGDLIEVVAVFAGAEGAQYGGGGGSGPEPTYELRGSLSETPFNEHEKWKSLTDEQREPLERMLDGSLTIKRSGESSYVFGYWEGNSWWPISEYDDLATDDTLEFAKLIAQGQTTYLRPVEVWTERTEGTQQLSNDQLNKLGKISTPRGDPPEAGGTRDWMLTSADQFQTGSKYSTFLQWTLSEHGGHNEFLYED